MREHTTRATFAAATVAVATVLDSQLRTALPLVLGDDTDGNEKTTAQLRLQQIADDLGAVGLQASPLLLHGNPRKILSKQAERLRADCIFLGAKGVSRIKQILVGTVATSVANTATCSVEIVR